VGPALLDLQHHLGVVLDPLRVVQDVPVSGLDVVGFRNHQAVATVRGDVMRGSSGSRTLLPEDFHQMLGVLLAEERLELVRRDEDHASLRCGWPCVRPYTYPQGSAGKNDTARASMRRSGPGARAA